ncbi:MAG TPA: FtsX-like permease family protein [Chloroflexi bacterium]|jgi:putative ABC transport system permease protein|nr:FtsX-like permease family protein [Chloroflexota bacterium]
MNLSESIRMALRSLRANTMRSLLTMLGIIIGTGAVIALLSIGQGAQTAITSEIQSIGSNLIFVFAGRFDQSSGAGIGSVPEPLTRQDADAILASPLTEHVAAVAPEINRVATITYRGETTTATLIGTTPEYEFVRSTRPALGAFFTSGEEAVEAQVALLGTDTARSLFGAPELAFDEIVRINGIPFRVIGILEERGGQGVGGGSADNQVIVPLSTAQRRLFGARNAGTRGPTVDLINVSAFDEESINSAIDEITMVLREQRNIQFAEDDFTVASQQDILSVAGQITSVLTIFLGAIAGISLLVGGIGIMNIMLVSVTERTREIGIRKAVGAKRSHILWQFLIESVVLSVVGGAVGIAFGWAVAAIVNQLGTFTTVVSPQSVALAVGFSIAVGLFFGIYPASRASNLNPIDALRYE